MKRKIKVGDLIKSEHNNEVEYGVISRINDNENSLHIWARWSDTKEGAVAYVKNKKIREQYWPIKKYGNNDTMLTICNVIETNWKKRLGK